MLQKIFRLSISSLLLFSAFIVSSAQAQNSPDEDKATAISSKKLLDVFVGAKPEDGTIFLAYIESAHGDGTKVLWMLDTPKGRQMIELATDQSELNSPSVRDDQQIGFTKKRSVNLDLAFKTESGWGLHIANSPDGSTPTTLTLFNNGSTTGQPRRSLTFTRPQAPWTTYNTAFKYADEYIPAYARQTSDSFVLHHDLETILADAEPRGPKLLYGVHSTQLDRFGLNNLIFFAQKDENEHWKHLRAAVITKNGVQIFETKISSDYETYFILDSGMKASFAIPRDTFYPQYSRDRGNNKIQNASADIEVAITSKSAMAKPMKFTTTGMAADDVDQIVKGKSPLIDSVNHAFFRDGHTCRQVLGFQSTP
jgi:hypothetical protein